MHTSAEIRPHRYVILIFLLITVFWTLRLGTLFTAVETVSSEEELAVGVIAKELNEGLRTSYWNFQIAPYAGESLIIAPITSLFFNFFGPHLISLKPTPVFLNFLTVLLASFMVKRYFDSISSLWVGFLLTFLPPLIAANTFISIAGHTESFFFTLCAVFFLFEYLFSPQKPLRIVHLIFFSLLSGLNFWIYYESVLAVITCLCVWGYCRPKDFWSKKLLLFCLYFAVGFSPWIIRALEHPQKQFEMFLILVPVRDLFYKALLVPKRIAGILLLSMPNAFSLSSHSAAGRIAGYCLYSALVAGTAYQAYRKLKLVLKGDTDSFKFLFFIIYPVIFLLIYALTDLDIPKASEYSTVYRYYIPLIFFLLIFSGLHLRHLSKKILYPVCFLLLLGQRPILAQEPFANGLKFKGYAYYTMGTIWSDFINPDTLMESLEKTSQYVKRENAEKVISGILTEYWGKFPFWWASADQTIPIDSSFSRVNADYRIIYTELASSFLSVNYVRRGGLEKLLQEAENTPSDLRKYFYKGILCDYYGYHLEEFLKTPALRVKIPSDHLHWAYFGLGRFYSINPQDEFFYLKINKLVRDLPEQSQAWYFRGKGSSTLQNLLSTINVYRDFKAAINRQRNTVPREFLPDFYWGIGWQLGELYPEDPVRATSWLKSLTGTFESHSMTGLNAYYDWRLHRGDLDERS